MDAIKARCPRRRRPVTPPYVAARPRETASSRFARLSTGTTAARDRSTRCLTRLEIRHRNSWTNTRKTSRWEIVTCVLRNYSGTQTVVLMLWWISYFRKEYIWKYMRKLESVSQISRVYSDSFEFLFLRVRDTLVDNYREWLNYFLTDRICATHFITCI